MKFNAFQKYLLTVYAVAIVFLTLCVPVYTTLGGAGFDFILFSNVRTINIGFLLTEYLALTLALVAALLATDELKRK